MFCSTSVSFATYNILNPYHAVKWGTKPGLTELGMNLSDSELKASTTAPDENAWRQYSSWDQRSKEISKNIQFADIVCLQEVSRETIENLLQMTKGYQLANAVYHESSRPIQEFGNAILYRSAKIQLKKTFEVHGPKGSSRLAACATFKIGEKLVKVASVHLAGYNPEESDPEKKQRSKVDGFEELKTYVKALEGTEEEIDGIVIGGDLNEDQNEAKFELYRPGYLESCGYEFDGNFGVTEPSKGRRIDWLCYKPLTSREATKLNSMGLESIQRQASDHLMTGTAISWVA